MRRRELLSGAAAALTAPAMPALAKAPRRRVRPGHAGWPSPSAWAGLNTEVGGRLIKPVSLTAACDADPRSADCTALYKSLANPYYIGDQPSGTQVSGWLDAWKPALSAWAVRAETSADVAAAVAFARRHNLRLAVKGGGHSYQGTSNAPDSLLVWTRAMNAVTVHDAFVPAGLEGEAAPVPAVSIGAGAMWVDAYDAVTNKAGRYVQGGGCATVGVAGLIQSGGFGSFSKRYGLAAGSLIEAEVVTADGRVRVVNAARDPDLLWALKGGGGGSFGAVTRLTLLTHEIGDAAGGFSFTIKAASDAAFRRLVGRFVDLYAEALCNPHWGESLQLRPDNVLECNMVFQGLTTIQAKGAWKPLLDHAAASDDLTLAGPHALAQPMRNWWDFASLRGKGVPWVKFDERAVAAPNHAWWSGDQGQVSAFFYAYDSLWLPASLLAPPQRPRLADALFAASRHYSTGLHFNKGLAGAPPDALARSRDAATNPAAVTAFALAIIADGGLPDYPGYPKVPLPKMRATAARIAAAADALRPVAPAGGSYVSESNYFNADWRRAFWGEHYPRLRQIKRRYDPEGLFTVHHGVGSEAWSADGFTRIA